MIFLLKFIIANCILFYKLVLNVEYQMVKLLSTLFLLLTFVGSTFIFGQGYIPLVKTNKLWNILRNFNGDIVSTYTARIQEIDTVINGNTYQKIVSDTLDILPQNFYTDLGYLREDINEKKVYYINEAQHVFYSQILLNNEEVLLYDFSLEEGDTTEVLTTAWCGEYGLTSLKVIEIDSIELINNTKRKRWQLQSIDSYSNFETVYWIEGVGSTFGLYMSSCNYTDLHGHKYDLQCYYEDNIHLYQSPLSDSCSVFWVSSVEDYEEDDLNFVTYPNPAADNFTIELKGHYNTSAMHYKLMDLTGKIVQKGSLINNNVSVSGLESGVYVVYVEEDGKPIGVRKVVVE